MDQAPRTGTITIIVGLVIVLIGIVVQIVGILIQQTQIEETLSRLPRP